MSDMYDETLRLTLQRDLDRFTSAGMTEEAGKVTERIAELGEAESEIEPEAEEAEDEEDVGDTGTGPYENRTRLQLVQVARTKGIKGAAQMRKDELIDELREG